MIFKCKKCNLVWYYPIKKCLYCKRAVIALKEKEYIVKGMTKVLIASQEHSQVPYYVLLLQDGNNNFHLKKSFQKQEIGDKIVKNKTAKYPKKIIGVIGTGVMGTGITQVFACSGFRVIIKSRTNKALNLAIQKIEQGLLKTMSIVEKDEIIKNIQPTTNLNDLLKADIVIESIIEDLKIKQQTLKELSNILSIKTIIATNTSSFSIDELASVVSHPERFIGMHFFNPVSKMDLIEIVQGKKTSDKTMNKIDGLVKQINKTPIITKNSPCFIVNRILMAYLNEALWEVEEGVAAAFDIDKAARLGLNHPIGPLALMDLIGLDVVLAIMNSLYQRTKNKKYLPCPILEKMVKQDKLGRKTKRGFFKY